jgi:predicted nucleotidyltransferase
VIPDATRVEIERRLERVEADEDVRILFAIESGSRAWGFASPDSDFDVRFIYCRRADWYYSVDVEDKRDVIEHPIAEDIDLNGWDLRKALRLLVRSNPTIVEWLQSPIDT